MVIQPLGQIKVTAKKIARIICNGVLAQLSEKWQMSTNKKRQSYKKRRALARQAANIAKSRKI